MTVWTFLFDPKVLIVRPTLFFNIVAAANINSFMQYA